jgi:hypothetical protein
MKFDIDSAFDLIEELTNLQIDTKTRMTKLIDYCESTIPSPLWSSIRKLDFEGDTDRLRNWLETVLSSESPSENINGYWLGIFNPLLADGQVSCDLYISGSTRYDTKDLDWAVLDSDSYLPENNEANSEILQRTYQLLKEHNLLWEAEYVLCLGYACIVVDSICRMVNPQLLLFGKNKKRAVVVGFDSGDWVVVREN